MDELRSLLGRITPQVFSLGLVLLLWLLVALLRLRGRRRRARAATAPPAWNQARIAILNPNGITFDLRHHLPVIARPDGPAYFKVGKELEVDGDTFTLRPGRRNEQRFTVREIASVCVEPTGGQNTLCDKDSRVLFTFRWDTENAALLAQYLMDRRVRFVELVGKGRAVSPELPEFPERFTVGKGVLSVDRDELRWKRPLRRASVFPVSQVASTAIHLPEETISLLDQDGAVLARYKSSMENADYMHNYLAAHLDSAR